MKSPYNVKTARADVERSIAIERLIAERQEMHAVLEERFDDVFNRAAGRGHVLAQFRGFDKTHVFFSRAAMTCRVPYLLDAASGAVTFSDAIDEVTFTVKEQPKPAKAVASKANSPYNVTERE